MNKTNPACMRFHTEHCIDEAVEVMLVQIIDKLD